jgi:hypothetical protein
MTPPVPLVTAEPSAYLGPDDVVQSDHLEITRLAKELSVGAREDTAFAKAAYEWVRDQVTHSVDAQFTLDRERLAYVADPGAGEVDYPDVLVRPAPAVLAALRGSDDVLELCRGGLPASLG